MRQKYGLNERQTDILRYTLENGSVSINDIEKLNPDAVRRTVQRDMKVLIEKGILKEKGIIPTDPTKRYIMAAH